MHHLAASFTVGEWLLHCMARSGPIRQGGLALFLYAHSSRQSTYPELHQSQCVLPDLHNISGRATTAYSAYTRTINVIRTIALQLWLCAPCKAAALWCADSDTQPYLRPDAHVVVLRPQLEGQEEPNKEPYVGDHPDDLYGGEGSSKQDHRLVRMAPDHTLPALPVYNSRRRCSAAARSSSGIPSLLLGER